MSTQSHTGLFGFGVVGQGFAQLSAPGKTSLPPIKSIVALNPAKKRPAHNYSLSFDKRSILSDPSIDIVVEAISNTAEAKLIVTEALRAGKKVITANKKLIAENFSELQELVRDFNGTLLYEAAVAASIPIIRTLEEHFAEEKIISLRGIVNGTSNFILTLIQEENKSYATALADAQVRGFAEADPTLDVSGRDAVNKLVILSAHAFGAVLHPDEILQFGITGIGIKEADIARSLGARIRLIARTKINKNGSLSAWVLPAFVPETDALSAVRREENAVEVVSESAGRQLYTGKGAGSLPTGMAVRADVLAATHGYKYKNNRFQEKHSPAYSDHENIRVYLGGLDAEKLEKIGLAPSEVRTIGPDKIPVYSFTPAELKYFTKPLQENGIVVISAEELDLPQEN